MNEYFLSVFTHENQTLIPEADQAFKREEAEKLRDVIIPRETVLEEIDRLKK